MMRRIWPWLLICAIASSMGSTFAFAQDKDDKTKNAKKADGDKEEEEGGDGMSFDEEEAGEVKAASPVQKFIQEGKSLYEKKKYSEASLLFYKTLAEKDVTAEPYWPEAEYELAKTLYKMKLYQGALTFFGKIVKAGEKHPYFMPTLRGLVLLTEEMPEDPLLMELLSAYQEFFPNEIPEKYRDRYAYLTGRFKYSQLEVEDALEMLSQVKASSDDYAKARYIAGVTHVANYDAEPAVDALKETLRTLTAKQANGKLQDDEKKLFELANLGMARVFYSTGQYETSIKYFQKVGRTSPLWPRALFESSWAFFQVDLYNKALGNLHSINSPFFSELYFPEGPILASVIYFYNCKYERSRHELEEFAFEYEPLVTEIDALIGQYGEDSDQMFDWLRKQYDDPETPEIRQIVNAALDDLQIRNKMSLIVSIEKEKEKINGMESAWKNSGLATNLQQELELAISFAKSDAGQIAGDRLERVSRELDDLTLEREKILVEISKAEQGQIESDLASEMIVSSNVTDAESIDVSDEELYWTFDGEYWRDELGYYLFNINSECKR